MENTMIYCKGFKKKKKDDFVYVEDRTPVAISENSKKLIVGTMISYRGRFLEGSNTPIDETFDYFYPNTDKNGLWVFLASAIGEKNIPKSKNEKERFLNENNLGMVNLIKSAYCKPDNSDDAEIVIKSLRDNFLSKIEVSNVNELDFTSINARELFWFLLELSKIEFYFLESQRDDVKSKIRLFNKDIWTHTLPTPTNRGKKGETKEWKLLQYKKIFQGEEI